MPHVILACYWECFQVVPAAVGFWERALKVRRMDATVRLNRKCENNQYFLSPGDPTQGPYSI